MPFRAAIGSFRTSRAMAKSIRQRHATGPMYNRRKYFAIQKGHHQLHRRISGRKLGIPTTNPEHTYFAHHGGDVARRPEHDFTFDDRSDKALYAWKKRGELQVYQLSGKTETFVCFRCGYPVKSNLQVIKSDNWDWRMCYRCYQSVLRHGEEHDI